MRHTITYDQTTQAKCSCGWTSQIRRDSHQLEADVTAHNRTHGETWRPKPIEIEVWPFDGKPATADFFRKLITGCTDFWDRGECVLRIPTRFWAPGSREETIEVRSGSMVYRMEGRWYAVEQDKFRKYYERVPWSEEATQKEAKENGEDRND